MMLLLTLLILIIFTNGITSTTATSNNSNHEGLNLGGPRILVGPYLSLSLYIYIYTYYACIYIYIYIHTYNAMLVDALTVNVRLNSKDVNVHYMHKQRGNSFELCNTIPYYVTILYYTPTISV